MRKLGWRTIAALAFIYSLYTAGATLFMRLTGQGIQKRAAAKEGIALTFDDGPHPVYTPRLLDLLAAYRVQAIFFVVGSRAEQHPELLQRMQAEGHAIGIHHYRHRSLWRLSPWQARREIRRTSAIIEQATGRPPQFYRPPYGRLTALAPYVARPYQLLLWTHIPGDWKMQTCDAQLPIRLRTVPANGSVVVLHDDGSNRGADDEAPGHMLRVLDDYLKECGERGIRILPPDRVGKSRAGAEG